MRSCEGTGRTIEQAIQNALFDLKASRDDVDIKILSEGGFLKKAKVLVTISEDALPKYEKIEALKKEEKKEEVKLFCKTVTDLLEQWQRKSETRLDSPKGPNLPLAIVDIKNPEITTNRFYTPQGNSISYTKK